MKIEFCCNYLYISSKEIKKKKKNQGLMTSSPIQIALVNRIIVLVLKKHVVSHTDGTGNIWVDLHGPESRRFLVCKKYGLRAACCGNTSKGVFQQLFRVLLNFHECSYHSIETRRMMFSISFNNTATKTRKANCLL